MYKLALQKWLTKTCALVIAVREFIIKEDFEIIRAILNPAGLDDISSSDIPTWLKMKKKIVTIG